MGKPQLSLVDMRVELLAAPQDPVRQVFDHWLYLNDKNPRRCKLGPTRRQVISGALALYDVETVLLAVEGMAANALEGKPDSMREAMRDIEWFLATERRIERCAELGEAVRAEAARAAARPAAAAARPTAAEQADAEAGRQRFRELVRSLRGGARG